MLTWMSKEELYIYRADTIRQQIYCLTASLYLGTDKESGSAHLEHLLLTRPVCKQTTHCTKRFMDRAEMEALGQDELA